jgi:hypothetical protein
MASFLFEQFTRNAIPLSLILLSLLLMLPLPLPSKKEAAESRLKAGTRTVGYAILILAILSILASLAFSSPTHRA